MNILMQAVRFDESLARLRQMGVDENLRVRDIELYGREGVSGRPHGPRPPPRPGGD